LAETTPLDVIENMLASEEVAVTGRVWVTRHKYRLQWPLVEKDSYSEFASPSDLQRNGVPMSILTDWLSNRYGSVADAADAVTE